MILVSIFVSYKYGFVQIYLAAGVAFFSFLLHFFRNPIQNERLDRLENINLLFVGLIAMLGIFFSRIPFVNGFWHIVLIFTIAMNFVYFIQWFIELIRLRINAQMENNEKRTELVRWFGGFKVLKSMFFDDDSFAEFSGVRNQRAKIELVDQTQGRAENSSVGMRADTHKAFKENEEESLQFNRD